MTTDAEQHEAWLASRPAERVEALIAFQHAIQAMGAVDPMRLVDAIYAEAADCAIEDADAAAEDKRDPIQGIHFAMDMIRLWLDSISAALVERAPDTRAPELAPEPRS